MPAQAKDQARPNQAKPSQTQSDSNQTKVTQSNSREVRLHLFHERFGRHKLFLDMLHPHAKGLPREEEASRRQRERFCDAHHDGKEFDTDSESEDRDRAWDAVYF